MVHRDAAGRAREGEEALASGDYSGAAEIAMVPQNYIKLTDRRRRRWCALWSTGRTRRRAARLRELRYRRIGNQAPSRQLITCGSLQPSHPGWPFFDCECLPHKYCTKRWQGYAEAVDLGPWPR